MTRRALDVRARYEAFDVGDLAKLVQAHEGVRSIEDAREALEHELADVLWSVMVIADRCGVDLAIAFEKTMDDLHAALARLAEEG